MELTIVTVVYNAESCIEKTIQSVLQQTVAPYEYIIKDGASKDHTVQVAQQYTKLFQARGVRYRVISETDCGIYDAMNHAVLYATGSHIAFLNADDSYESDAVEVMQQLYQHSPYDFAYGTIRYVGEKGKLFIKKSRLDTWVSSRNWNHPSSVVKKDLYLHHPFNLSLGIYADFDWFLAMRKLPIRIEILPTDKVITNFRIGGVSSNSHFRDALTRAREKFQGYRRNGYSSMYFFEAYGWEIVKFVVSKSVSLFKL